jgi:ribosomal protein S4
MPRRKKAVSERKETGKTVYDLLELVAFVKTKKEAQELFDAGKIKVNGKKVSPSTLLSTFPGREFNVQAGPLSAGIYVADW